MHEIDAPGGQTEQRRQRGDAAARGEVVGTVGELWLHPVKSCAARPVASAEADARGLVGDRRWMWVDGAGRFLSQRSHPALARVWADLTADGLRLQLAPADPSAAAAAPAEPLRVATPVASQSPITVEVWGTRCGALDAGDAPARWLRDQLGVEARLVRQHGRRATDPRYAEGHEVSFADGFPLLVATAAAVREVTARTERSPDSRRFRPNLVIEGAPAFREDRWRRLRIGEVEIALVKPCGRCGVLDVDPTTGARDVGLLKSLRPDRWIDGELRFGMNAVVLQPGRLRVGDVVEHLG